jgi:CRP-like cAMP-binding protein
MTGLLPDPCMLEIFQHYINSKASITNEEFETIKSLCIIKKLRKKQYLLQEGDVWKYNAFICQGCLRSYRVDDKGLEHIINFAIENHWTGDRESILSGNPAKLNIDAIEDSTLILITKENFETICKEIPAFNDMVNAILHRSFIASQNRIHAAISFTAEEKYLNFINTSPEIANRVPQHMIASYLGISPETLSRVRNQTARK